MLPVECLEEKFYSVLESPEWHALQEAFNSCDTILCVGNGGNLAVVDHASSDISRLTNREKNAMAPGSGALITALISDTSWEEAMAEWVNQRLNRLFMNKVLVLAVSSSGRAKNLLNALDAGRTRDAKVSMISAKPSSIDIPGLINVVLDVDYYHTAEVLSLLLTYELIHGAGFMCPSISSKIHG